MERYPESAGASGDTDAAEPTVPAIVVEDSGAMASTPAFLRPTDAGLVADVETFVVDNPPPHFGGRYFVFVKVTTTEGVVGWGEIYAATFHPVALPALVADVAGRHLLDRDPHNIETFTAAAMSRGYSGRPEITLGAIVSGLEMACWGPKLPAPLMFSYQAILVPPSLAQSTSRSPSLSKSAAKTE